MPNSILSSVLFDCNHFDVVRDNSGNIRESCTRRTAKNMGTGELVEFFGNSPVSLVAGDYAFNCVDTNRDGTSEGGGNTDFLVLRSVEAGKSYFLVADNKLWTPSKGMLPIPGPYERYFGTDSSKIGDVSGWNQNYIMKRGDPNCFGEITTGTPMEDIEENDGASEGGISGDINCGGDIYDCDDFSDWAQAQTVFNYCGIFDNVHGLDGSPADFIACESFLPEGTTSSPHIPDIDGLADSYEEGSVACFNLKANPANYAENNNFENCFDTLCKSQGGTIDSTVHPVSNTLYPECLGYNAAVYCLTDLTGITNNC